jgi:SsrA-binding protein
MAHPKKDERKILVRNRKARHELEIDSTYEAGLVLVGSEVKSLRESHGSLLDAFVQLRHGEAWLMSAQIEPYAWANQFNHEPRRDRKLLLHRAEIRRIGQKVREKGFTLVPLEIYLVNGKIKVEIALARGRKMYEKRQAKKADEAQREMERGKKG